ncbi:hypothetical protein TWF694_010908 [Orbilia ellipsospora]|uniref:Enoyl reductase (ER) domain-containing protein n=1 Tax=Orbilia ellipsospora TaxID=2528407 RepID=A0AAV9X7F6_9PEZI
MSYTTKQWMLKEPTGDNIDVTKAFNLITKQVSARDLKEGEVLAKTVYISHDPAQRCWIHRNNVEGRLYRTPIGAGEPMEAFGVAEVLETRNKSYKTGDLIVATVHWTEYGIITPDNIYFKSFGDAADMVTLGLTGMTAYFGLLNVGAATPKDSTIVVSAAASSTGAIVCQIAKNVLGIKNVIGIAGSDAKCAMLTRDAGCDIALNYKSPTFRQEFEAATPNDIDLYFDNVGGEVTDMALLRMKDRGRVVVCGAISIYDRIHEKGGNVGISRASWLQVICHQVKIEGFIIFQFADQFPRALGDLATWTQEGKLKLMKDIIQTDITEVPKGMSTLFKGENNGKLITQLKV